MYEVFDRFLASDVWHKRNPSDEMTFFRVLHQVVRDHPAFTASGMRRYMLNKFGLSEAYDAADYRTMAIEHYTAAAQAVSDYFEATGQL